MSTKVVTVRMPSELHQKLIDVSAKRDQSMNFLCLDALANDVGIEEEQLDAWLLEGGLNQAKLKRERAYRPATKPADQDASPAAASGDRR